MPAQGSPVTLRTVLPQPSREERPTSEISRISDSMSRSGTWWIWMFCRVVMWPLLSGAYFSTTVGEGLHLLRRDAAEGQLHADHLHVGLALPVDALLEAEADELLFGELAGEELLGFVVEVVELALDDRDHVARDVLVGLRILQRAGAALAALLLVLIDDDLHNQENSKT